MGLHTRKTWIFFSAGVQAAAGSRLVLGWYRQPTRQTGKSQRLKTQWITRVIPHTVRGAIIVSYGPASSVLRPTDRTTWTWRNASTYMLYEPLTPYSRPAPRALGRHVGCARRLRFTVRFGQLGRVGFGQLGRGPGLRAPRSSQSARDHASRSSFPGLAGTRPAVSFDREPRASSRRGASRYL